jgi:RNA-directed DNA polymerase
VRKSCPAAAGVFMGKKYKHLIEQIADIENLRLAFQKTASGKRMTWGYLEFKEYAELNLERLQAEMLEGSWRQGSYREFVVYEPKPRIIHALEFKDRVAQHALCNVIGPIFDATLLPGTFACRSGMGTHAGVHHVQAALRRTGATHFLKTDYSKFFPSVDRSVLHGLIRRKISCRSTLGLIEAMLPITGTGLPIGSLTSQLFANVYGGQVDRFIHTTLGAREWTRYMDDIVILSSNPYELRHWFEDIESFSQETLGLRMSKWQISPVTRGINFLGYRIWPRHKLLRKQSVTTAKRKIAQYQKFFEEEKLQKFLASWRGHAAQADTQNLFNHLESKYGIECH